MLDKIKKELKNHNLFITGGGGVGKSYIIKKLQEELDDVAVTATTGVAAVNIGGQTIHSWCNMGIGLGTPLSVAERLKKNGAAQHKIDAIKNAKYLIIDEISMLNAYMLDFANAVIKYVRASAKPFGGIRVILVGDFLQLPPVKIHQMSPLGKGEIFIDYCFNSDTWKELKLHTILLDKVYRQADPEFIHILQEAREGHVSKEAERKINERAVGSVYQVPEKVVKLFCLNQSADAENTRQFDKIPGKARLYKAENVAYVWDKKKKERKYVNPDTANLENTDAKGYESFDSTCRLADKLYLKKGARVMLLSNLNFGKGLVNGSCGVVTSLNDDGVTVKFDNGEEKDIHTEIQGIRLDKKHYLFSREQLPLRLAYAVTVHKAQGLTFDKVFVDFSRSFEVGQSYVALSRVKTLDGLYTKGFTASTVKVDPEVLQFYNSLKSKEKK